MILTLKTDFFNIKTIHVNTRILVKLNIFELYM
jgi:hypothetical protein